MPHDIPHGDAVEMKPEQAHEGLLRSKGWVRGFAAVAQEQPKVAAGQRRHHQEVIGADAIVKVVCPIRKAVQMNIEVLKEAAGVVFRLNWHSEAAPHPGINAVGGDQIAAADQLFLVASIGMRDPRRDSVLLQGEALKRRVVLDALAKP